MRKIHLIELVEDYLSGGDMPDDLKGRYHPEIIANYLALAYNQVVMNTYMEAKTYSDYSVLDAWAKNYTVNITDKSGVTGRALLPFPPVQLPNGMGILQVNAGTDLTNTFAYRETNSNSVFDALEVGAVSAKPTFYLEQNTGSEINSHVLQLNKIPDGCTSVKIKMIVPLDQIDDFETVSIPAGKEDMLVKSTIELMIGKPPEDKVNDNKAIQA